MTDISKEAVEAMIAHLGSQSPASRECASKMIAALQARVEELEAQPHYRYIGRDGKQITARELEDQRDIAFESGRLQGLDEAALEGPIPCYETRHVSLGRKVRDRIEALKEQSQ